MTRTVHIYVQPTPEELAQEWCRLGADEQASFFNTIGTTVKEQWTATLGEQLQSVSDSHMLTKHGREVMRAIGEYAGIV